MLNLNPIFTYMVKKINYLLDHLWIKRIIQIYMSNILFLSTMDLFVCCLNGRIRYICTYLDMKLYILMFIDFNM